jgi:hypothetical protein
MQAGRSVAAEGLFRSALGYLQGPHGLHDPRSRLEEAVCLAGYGALLAAWEKREEGGREMQLQARGQLAGLLPGKGADTLTPLTPQMPLTALMQLPQLDSEV